MKAEKTLKRLKTGIVIVSIVISAVFMYMFINGFIQTIQLMMFAGFLGGNPLASGIEIYILTTVICASLCALYLIPGILNIKSDKLKCSVLLLVVSSLCAANCLFYLLVGIIINMAVTSNYEISNENSVSTLLMVLTAVGMIFFSAIMIMVIAYKKIYRGRFNHAFSYDNPSNDSKTTFSYLPVCSKCGKTLNEDMKFCVYCGNPTGGEAKSAEPSVPHTNAASTQDKPLARTATQSVEWQCPGCGRINKNYVGTCGCGTRRP